MAKAHRLPAQFGVAICAFNLYRNMVNRFAGSDIIVVAIFTAAKDLLVVDNWNGLKPDGAVASVATFAGKNVVDRFRRGIKAAINAVAGNTLGRGAGKLPTNVATFARHKVVAASQFEAGFGMVKRFVLGRGAVLSRVVVLGRSTILRKRDAFKAQHQHNQAENP